MCNTEQESASLEVFTKCSGNLEEGKGHLPREVRDSFTEEVATELRQDQRSAICHVDRRADRMTGAKSEPQGPLGGAGYAVFLEQKVRWGEGRRSEASGRGSDHEEPADQSSIYPTKAIR